MKLQGKLDDMVKAFAMVEAGQVGRLPLNRLEPRLARAVEARH